MPTLNEYLGGLIASVTNARVMADAQTVAVAEQYARHDLLKHFAVPRMRIGDIELTIPVAIEGLANRTEYQLAPIGNDRFRTEIYRTFIGDRDVKELPLLASNDLNSVLMTETANLIDMLRQGLGEKAHYVFAEKATQQYFEILFRYRIIDPELSKIDPQSTIDLIFKRSLSLASGIEEKPVLDQLSVVAESHRLREQRPEDIVRIRLKIGEDGMEWQTIEKSDGTLERRLLPE
jgi:hypothetical protein